MGTPLVDRPLGCLLDGAMSRPARADQRLGGALVTQAARAKAARQSAVKEGAYALECRDRNCQIK